MFHFSLNSFRYAAFSFSLTYQLKMSNWATIPQYEEDSDGELWLNNFLSNLNSSTSGAELKESESQKFDTEMMKKGCTSAPAEEIIKIGCATTTKPQKIGCSTVAKPAKMKVKKVKSPEINKQLKHDNWLGYIIAVFINETITQSTECCPGCKDSKNSPLFHSHHHSGLLEKLYMFAPSVRAMLISKLPLLVADYVSKFPDVEIYDDAGRKVLTNIGRTFIRQCNPTFVYYSRYLTPIVDEVVTTTPILKSQPMTLKRVANAAQRGSDSSKKMKTQ